MRHTMSEAAAKRIAADLTDSEGCSFLTWGRVIQALESEGAASPERMVPDLIRALHDIPGYEFLAMLIGCAAASKAREAVLAAYRLTTAIDALREAAR